MSPRGRLRWGTVVFVAGFVAMGVGIAILVGPVYDEGASETDALAAVDHGFLVAGAGLVALVLGGILVKNAIARPPS